MTIRRLPANAKGLVNSESQERFDGFFDPKPDVQEDSNIPCSALTAESRAEDSELQHCAVFSKSANRGAESFAIHSDPKPC